MWGMHAPNGWDVMWHALPRDIVGVTSWQTLTIIVDPICPPSMQRCTLAHELIHVERGPVMDEPTIIAREELAVEKQTARRLIDVRELGEAMVESSDLGHVADILVVDLDLLAIRLTYLDEAEESYLRDRFERIQPTA